jgi:hypothetical protein
MTEAEWLTATFALLFMQEAETIRSDPADRTVDEWRAVAARVACLRRLGPDMPAGVRRWVAAATAYLDREERQASAAGLLFDDSDDEGVYRAFREAYAGAGPELRQKLAAAQDVYRGADYYACEEYLLEQDELSLTYAGPVYAAEHAAHCDLIRDVFGNPFRPVTLDRSLLTPTVASLAEAAYEHRELPSGHLELARLAVLSDALEEAGVTEEVLTHLRSPGPHVRGCWAVDLILAKDR